MTSRLLLVSNRLPVSVKRSGKEKTLITSSGGLVAGLDPVHHESQGLWLGNFDSGEAKNFAPELKKRRLVPVILQADDAERHYEGYSNQVLWPLHHYLLEHVEFDGPDYEAYARVNARFADAVVKSYQPGDQIWVHDYHLMLLPGLLRQRLPDAVIGFFLHIPFPSSEVFRLLPRKENILRGLLGANLVGLHTYDDARHFMSSCHRVLGADFDDDWRHIDGHTRVGVFPLGVDVAHHKEMANSEQVERHLQRLRRRVQGRKVILGVDRMDYTKGLPMRLRAFRRLLETQKQWRKEAVLVQLAVPSRGTIVSYKSLKDGVEQLVGSINGAYQAVDGLPPIQYMHRSVPPEELAALYRLADVCLVTPTRDGMNLVAKEYVASRVDDTGVLVLSEFAGAAAEMRQALLVNPFDIDTLAQTLDRALTMPPDAAAERMKALRFGVNASTVHHWVERFLSALKAAGDAAHQTDDSVAAANAWTPRAIKSFASAKRALLALDYDGTLAELAPTPAQAKPTAALIKLLTELSALPGVDVMVISGRDPGTLNEWLGKASLHLVAEHGFHVRHRGQTSWESGTKGIDTAWKDEVRKVMDGYSARAPGAFTEEKPVSLVWHYRLAQPGLGQWLARALARDVNARWGETPLVSMHGNKVVEVRPPGFDKGQTLLRLVEEAGLFDFVLAAGDDRTDEDMFRVLAPPAWTVKVGASHVTTAARSQLSTPKALRAFLEALLSARRNA